MKIILTKWQLCERGYAVCAMTVQMRTKRVLPQLLMDRFDTLPLQCRHTEHLHVEV